MPDIAERVAFLEGKVEEHTRDFGEIRQMLVHLDQKVDRFREELSTRIDSLEYSINLRLTGFENRINGVEDRINSLDASLNRRIDALDQKVSRQFMWIIGIQVATILAVVGALIGVA